MPISHRDLMLATSASAPFSKPGWIFEPKYDGYRILACRETAQVRLISRGGIDYAGFFPDLVAELKALPEAVIDGELVVLDHLGMPHFDRLRSYVARRRPAKRSGEVVAIFAFDLLAVHGQDLRAQPLIERKEALARLLKNGRNVRYLQHAYGDGIALYRYFEQLGLEGVVGKRADAPYRAGPTQTWKKVKTPAFKAIERHRLAHKRR